MKKAYFALSVAALSVTAVALMGFSPAPVAEVGKAAPGFSLPGASGKTQSLDAYKGKWVVLEWTNHDCPVVVRHYNSGNMQATQKWAKEKGAVWLQVVSSAPGKQGHIDAAQAKQIAAARKDVVTDLLFDPKGEVGRQYGAKTTPHMYIISPKGELLYNGAIDNDSRGREAKPTNYVIQGLSEAMAGKELSVKTSQPYGCGVKY